ncbi:MAG: hypothetical protein ABJB40_14190 [Acidobacteriota bacterium]
MKRVNLMASMALAAVLLAAGAVYSQDKKMEMPMPKDGMDMSKMHADGHHMMMMAYQHNALAFTRALWEMASDGKIEDLGMARTAFAEIKRSLEKADEVHQMHMSMMPKMDAAMMQKMKPMMDKMEADKAALKGHVHDLENALQAKTPNAGEIEMHAAALLLKLEKMGPEKMMPM